MRPALAVEEISSPEALAALAPSWWDLWVRTPSASVVELSSRNTRASGPVSAGRVGFSAGLSSRGFAGASQPSGRVPPAR